MLLILPFLLCALSLNTFVYADTEEQKAPPQDLCEAIQYDDPQWFEYYITREDINSCGVVKKLDNGVKVASGIMGLFTGPMAPLIWYATFSAKPETPLSTAVWHRQVSMIPEIIKRGASLNMQDSMGYTALHWASSALIDQETYYIMAEQLLDSGAQLSLFIADNEGLTPLHWAIRKRNNIIAKLLIARGADVNAQDKQGKTPLHYAYERVSRLADSEDILATLEKAGATQIVDHSGKYPHDYSPEARETGRD